MYEQLDIFDLTRPGKTSIGNVVDDVSVMCEGKE